MRRLASVLGAAAGLLVAGCGDDGDNKTVQTTPAAEGNVFKADDVAFTFRYPDSFKQVDDDNGKLVAVVTPNPGDEKNGVKIRWTSAQPLPYESYLDTFRKQFEDDLGVKVAKRVEKHGDIPMGVLAWSKPFTYKDLGEEKTTRLTSTSYFFVTGGKAWQIECLSDADHKDAIDGACKQALDTIEPVN